MTNPVVLPPTRFDPRLPSLESGREEFVEAPWRRNRESHGAIVGVVLGTGLWAAILLAAGFIKL